MNTHGRAGKCRPAATAVLALALSLAACGDGEPEQRTETFSPQRAQETRAQLPPELAAALDSGNAAYREGDYERARSHFRGIVEEDSTVTAAWFGIYMAEQALGNEEAAKAALDRAGDLSGGASMMHPAPGEEGDGASAGETRPGTNGSS